MIENTWVFPALEALHVVGLALLVGTIVLGDLRALGVTKAVAPRRGISIGILLMVTTGTAMFLSDPERYRQNPAFLVKMAVLAVLVVFHLTYSRRMTWTTAILSIVLWTFAILAARAVIDFDA